MSSGARRRLRRLGSVVAQGFERCLQRLHLFRCKGSASFESVLDFFLLGVNLHHVNGELAVVSRHRVGVRHLLAHFLELISFTVVSLLVLLRTPTWTPTCLE